MNTKRAYVAIFIAAALIVGSPTAALAAATDLDPTFGTGGKVWGEQDRHAHEVLVQKDGKVVVASQGPCCSAVWQRLGRYNPDGTPDTGFGPSGTGEIFLDEEITDLATTEHAGAEKLVLAYQYRTEDTSSQPQPIFGITRLLPNGSPDPSFGDGGSVVTGQGRLYSAEMAVQADGKILHSITALKDRAGDSVRSWEHVIVRYTADGQLDSTFGKDGRVRLGAAGQGEVWVPLLSGSAGARAGIDTPTPHRIGVQAQTGKIIIAGAVAAIWQPEFAVAPALMRLKPDGSRDETFGTGGIVLRPTRDAHERWWTYQLRIAPDDKILTISDATSGTQRDLIIRRYTPDGQLDGSFGQSGTTTVPHAAGYRWRGDFDAAGGLVLVGGWKPAMIRLLPDGSLDGSFGTGGRLELDYSAHDVAVQPDQKFVAAGQTDRLVVARYMGDAVDGPPPPAAGAIRGRVTNSSTKAGIAGAVVDCGSGFAVSTDGAGNYTLASVPAGNYTCTATASGYQSKTQKTTVSAGTTTTLDFQLRPRR